MKVCLLLFACSVALAQYNKEVEISNDKVDHISNSARVKRNAVGALHIITNHAQPIHADVKPENGDIEKVTPPGSAFYEVKSLRKSLPLSNKLDLIRSISRVITLTVLVISAVMEFYPLFERLYYAIYL